MTTRKKRRPQTAALRLQFSLRWERFSYERTAKRQREWLYSVIDTLVSCSIPAPCCLGQFISTICEQGKISIEMLSVQLRNPVLSRPKIVFGSIWDEIDEVVSNYANMQWWVSEKGLTIDTIIPPPPAADFNHTAGRLLFEMRKRAGRSRLSPEQYQAIAAQLEGFALLDVLPKAFRKRLADWNQKNGKFAIRTFSQALNAKNPRGLRRETLRVLYRTQRKLRPMSHDRFSFGPYA